MTTASQQTLIPSPRSPAACGPLPEGEGPKGPALPSVVTALGAPDVLARLDGASRRGRLPGFVREGERAFRAQVFGEPFDRDLHGTIEDRPGGGSVIQWRLTLRRKMPAIAALLTLFTAWPGVWLTHSMLGVYFAGYPSAMWVTLAWYVPLVVAPMPILLRRQWRKSERVALEECARTIEKVAGEVRGEVGGR